MEQLTSLHGRKAGLAHNGQMVVPAGYLAGSHGSQIEMPSPSRCVLFDDFLGDVVADQWNFTEGTDSGTSDGAISAQQNGAFLLTPGDSAGTVAADGAQLNSELNWKANSAQPNRLVFEARVKLASIAQCSCFVGFTDTKSLEQPIQSAGSGDTITTNATDAVGFMFDVGMNNDNWYLVGVANDVDATVQDSGVAVAADTWATLRVEIDASGVAYFFINGNPVGSAMSGAVRTTIALTPVFIVRPTAAVAGKTMTIDYCHVAGDRV